MKNSTEQCASAAMDVRSHSEFVDALGSVTERTGKDLFASRIEKRLKFNTSKVLCGLSLLVNAVF